VIHQTDLVRYWQYETPSSIHRVSRNASMTAPAKLLAVFVVDTDDKNLTTPLK
jgi:hypothetical protein